MTNNDTPASIYALAKTTRAAAEDKAAIAKAAYKELTKAKADAVKAEALAVKAAHDANIAKAKVGDPKATLAKKTYVAYAEAKAAAVKAEAYAAKTAHASKTAFEYAAALSAYASALDGYTKADASKGASLNAVAAARVQQAKAAVEQTRRAAANP